MSKRHDGHRGMKEGLPVYGKKHERKEYGRRGRKKWRGNILRRLRGDDDA